MTIRSRFSQARVGLAGFAVALALSVQSTEECGYGGYILSQRYAFVSQEEAPPR